MKVSKEAILKNPIKKLMKQVSLQVFNKKYMYECEMNNLKVCKA